jgi:hypothetical protein
MEVSAKDKKTFKQYAISLVVIILLIVVAFYGYFFVTTPPHIRNPKYEHHHFRTQLVVEGRAIDFGENKFQEPTPNVCSGELAPTPIHFHDNLDQMTHVHWQGMTGGEFLKYYGWNFIAGNDKTLGYRFDEIIPRKVGIHGRLLPQPSANAQYYVYIGDEHGYQQKDWNDFIYQDLEQFFGKQSRVPKSTSFLNWFIPKASAHGDDEDSDSHEIPTMPGAPANESKSPKSQEELTRINNLIGNVVIFVQEREPTDEQIKARFNKLVPLQDSICGG